MRKNTILFLAGFLNSVVALSQYKVNTITEKGAWCWFADPRAINYKSADGGIDATYVGYIDVHGNVKATQLNHLTNRQDEVLIRSYFQPDDHNNPTFLMLPDERVMIFYSRHTDEPCFYYRISQRKGDITTLGEEIRLATSHNTTYPSPFILSDDPNHIYLCWRGINWHPTIARMTMPDTEDKVLINWGPYQMVQSNKGEHGVRPYAKYASNGKDKIYMTYTTTHPDNQPINYVYFNTMDINTHILADVKGNKLAVVGDGALHNVYASADYTTQYGDAVVEDSPFRNWVWEISMDEDKYPVIAMSRISEDKMQHSYYHVRWNGEKWIKTFLTEAGGPFHQTPSIEKCYSGGMAIDKSNPKVFYTSQPVVGKHGEIYELKRYETSLEGLVIADEQITYNSEKNNIRPYVIASSTAKSQLCWMHGDYYDWIVSSSRPDGYPTEIHTTMEMPAVDYNSKRGLIKRHLEARLAPVRDKTVKLPKLSEFTLSFTLWLDEESYSGEILDAGSFRMGISLEKNPTCYITLADGKMVKSTNVLGTADVWRTKGRGTTGEWFTPTKHRKVKYAVCVANGEMRTYINGMVDQYIEVGCLQLSKLKLGEFKGTVTDMYLYNRLLTTAELKGE